MFGFEIVKEDSSSNSSFLREMKSDFKDASFTLEGLTCSSCSTAVQSTVSKIPGIQKESIRVAILPRNKLFLSYNPSAVDPQKVVDAVEEIGFGASYDEYSSAGQGNETLNKPLKATFQLEKGTEYAVANLAVLPGVESVVPTRYYNEDATYVSGRRTNSDLAIPLLLSSSTEFSPGATLLVSYDEDRVGARTILEWLQNRKDIFGEIKLLDSGGNGFVEDDASNQSLTKGRSYKPRSTSLNDKKKSKDGGIRSCLLLSFPFPYFLYQWFYRRLYLRC